MKRSFFILSRTPLAMLGMIGVLLLTLQASVLAEAQSELYLTGRWDRLNPDPNNPSPEHEVLRCGGNARWNCVYDKHPEPTLGFEQPPDSTFGQFRGENITSDWACPGWFPSDICDNTLFAAGGVMDFAQSDGSELVVDQELIVTNIGGTSILYVYWVNDQFVCPWFRSFDEAVRANPFPTPFNGEDWPAVDCLFGP
jgi:hypothetical protein